MSLIRRELIHSDQINKSEHIGTDPTGAIHPVSSPEHGRDTPATKTFTTVTLPPNNNAVTGNLLVRCSS